MEVEGNCLAVHDDPAGPTGGTIPGMLQGDVLGIALLILIEGRLEDGGCRLDLTMVRAPGKNWRVEPVWA
jgi:hypothetical protein